MGCWRSPARSWSGAQRAETDFRHLWRGIADQWRSYVAYVVSFTTIGAIWLVHHGKFRRLASADAVGHTAQLAAADEADAIAQRTAPHIGFHAAVVSRSTSWLTSGCMTRCQRRRRSSPAAASRASARRG
jgi:hypothetical protein